MQFADLYGTELDTELGTTDRTQRFTTVLRKRYVNEGQRVFSERTGCYIKRGSIALEDAEAEYDIEAELTDYLWPSKTSASLKRDTSSGSGEALSSGAWGEAWESGAWAVGAWVDEVLGGDSGTLTTDYIEGPALPYKAEEELNQTRPNWRAESAGIPQCWTFRMDGGSTNVALVPAPDIPDGETWTLLWPYVAQPPDMTDDAHEPWGNAAPRIALRPYHRAVIHYAAAQLEKLRKNWEGVERQMKLFGALVTAFTGDQKPQNGSRIRVATDYRSRLRSQRPADPTR